MSGKLDAKLFGPGTLDMKMNRRSIYFFVKRSQLIPMLSLFDTPDTLQDLATRSNTTVAPQALLLLNSPIIREYAVGLALKTKGPSESDLRERVRQVYRECFSRSPFTEETKLALEFIQQQQSDYDMKNAVEVAISDWCQAIMSLNEFVFVD